MGGEEVVDGECTLEGNGRLSLTEALIVGEDALLGCIGSRNGADHAGSIAFRQRLLVIGHACVCQSVDVVTEVVLSRCAIVQHGGNQLLQLHISRVLQLVHRIGLGAVGGQLGVSVGTILQLKALGFSNEDFLLAAKSGTASTQETVRSRIRWMVDTKINRTFNDFYKTEEIYLDNPFYVYHRNN